MHGARAAPVRGRNLNLALQLVLNVEIVAGVIELLGVINPPPPGEDLLNTSRLG
jgi:hypothetical protein